MPDYLLTPETDSVFARNATGTRHRTASSRNSREAMTTSSTTTTAARRRLSASGHVRRSAASTAQSKSLSSRIPIDGACLAIPSLSLVRYRISSESSRAARHETSPVGLNLLHWMVLSPLSHARIIFATSMGLRFACRRDKRKQIAIRRLQISE